MRAGRLSLSTSKFASFQGHPGRRLGADKSGEANEIELILCSGCSRWISRQRPQLRFKPAGAFLGVKEERFPLSKGHGFHCWVYTL